MAVESRERWNGWLGPTHCLIYPQCPCEHSGEIHYLTSSITSYGQGKRPAFHTDTHPRDQLARLTQWGMGSKRNVVTHRERKCLSRGRGELNVQHRILSSSEQLRSTSMWILQVMEIDEIVYIGMVSLLLWER